MARYLKKRVLRTSRWCANCSVCGHSLACGPGLRGLSRRGRRSYGGQGTPCIACAGARHVVGAPPSGRWVVSCEAYRDEGVAPTGGKACGASRVRVPCMLQEPRPRRDGAWPARLIATRASLLRGTMHAVLRECGCHACCRSPALGAMGCGLQRLSRRGRRSYGGQGMRCIACVGVMHFVGAPPSGRWVVACEAYRDESVAPRGKMHAIRGCCSRSDAAFVVKGSCNGDEGPLRL